MKKYTIYNIEGRLDGYRHGFSWLALVFDCFYLAFKRMWKHAGIIFGISIIFGMFIDVTVVHIIFGIIVGIICGFNYNTWFDDNFGNYRKVEVEADGMDAAKNKARAILL